MAVAEVNGASVAELRDELARERRELAGAIGELERSVAIGPRLRAHRWLIGGVALVLFLLALRRLVVRPVLRRRRRDRVLVELDRFALVRRGR